eukprot:9870077-Prorocentrum_lima.AAC.1
MAVMPNTPIRLEGLKPNTEAGQTKLSPDDLALEEAWQTNKQAGVDAGKPVQEGPTNQGTKH